MIKDKFKYDVIVVGGGHAGTEAALASCKMGVKTLLLTDNIDTLGQMSCNPAIGGIGKGHLTKEIDAMGGAMALAIDKSGIQFRTLNKSKGPAVWATRVQADRELYKRAIRNTLESAPNLEILQLGCEDLILENEKVIGVKTKLGVTIYATTVILTVGTFLAGRIHVGKENFSGGRAGDPAAISLAQKLRDIGFTTARLKTGTPPRIDSRTIDYSLLEKQYGDTPRPIFSFWSEKPSETPQKCCYITHTNPKTHKIITDNIKQSALFSGNIEGFGARYCPSIEDKIQKFSHRDSHQIYLEPEGLNSAEVYPNGISTSLPFDVQVDFVRSIKGLENANITRPGYAIEYDYFDPRNLCYSLETKKIENLFFAGQINGTTGYEEAGAQGLLAGINAALKVQEKSCWYPERHEAYIGVLVDDLVSKGTLEPYRMFTSRAEYRLQLREDNAILRLADAAFSFGLLNNTQFEKVKNLRSNIDSIITKIKKTYIQPGTDLAQRLTENMDLEFKRSCSVFDVLKRPKVEYAQLHSLFGESLELESVDSRGEHILNCEVKYSGYITRQQLEVEQLSKIDKTKIPVLFDFTKVSGLSNEVVEKLQLHKPKNIGEAKSISGVTPAAIALIRICLQRQEFYKAKDIIDG